MAAFSFPQNPNNGDTVQNSATGIIYVFSATPAPGKWEVQMQSSDSDYVNVTGDTMTGPLDIVPSTVIPASTQDSTLMIKAAPFSAAAEDQNYISRVFEAKTNQDHTIFGIRDNDAANLPITQGRISAVTSYAADTLIQPSLNSITADNFPSSGLRAGFRIGGRQQGGAFGDVLDCTYFDDAGTQINYYGDMLTDNSLVTKKYVDDGHIDTSLIHGGTIAEGSEGSISGSGNLAIQRSTSNQGGNFYIRTTEGSNLITAEQPGRIQLTPNAAIGGGILNIVSAYSADNSSNYAIKARYLDSTNTSNVYLQINANTQLLEYTGEVQVRGDLKIQTTSAVSNITLTNSGNITANGVVTITGDQSEFFKGRGHDGDRDFVIYGSTQTNPTQADDILFGTYRNTLNNASQPDAIAYFGKVDGADNIQTKTSVEALISSAVPSSIPTDFSFNDLTVTGRLSGTPGGAAGNLDVFADSLNIPKDGGLLIPDAITIASNGTPTLQLPNNRSFFIRNDNKIGTTAPIDNVVGYVSATGVAAYKTVYLFGSGIAGSDNPDAAGQYSQIQFSHESNEYAIFQSKGYTQNGYQIYADTTSGTPKKMFNFLLSGDGTKGYLNCYYAPQGPNGLVRLSDLATGVVGSVNTYSVSGGLEGSDEATYHISNHNIPGQCSFEGLQGAGAGFNLTGRTADQPTNPSALLLRASHFSSAAAQVEYFGDTTGTDNCLQTKSSVAAMLSDAVAGIDNSTLYGQTTVLNGADGSAAQFRIRNSTNTGDVYKINNDGSVNSYGGSYNFIGATRSDVGIASNSSSFTDTSLTFYTRLGGTKTAQFKILSNSIFAYKQFNMSSGGQCTGDFSLYGNGNVVIDTGQLKLNTNTGGATIVMNGTAAVGGITVAGNSNKTFKIFAGETLGQTTKQVFAISQSLVQFGTSETNQSYQFLSSAAPTDFNFTQSVALKFNSVANPITLSQGSIANVSTLTTASDATSLQLQCLGGPNQFVELKGTNSNSEPMTVAKFTALNAYLNQEIDLFGQGGGNTKIYSYGYSRGLEIHAADYNTAKGNAKIAAKFEAGVTTFMTNITLDNTSAYAAANPNTDITVRVGTGAQGAAAAYPKLQFVWATDTGVTYQNNFTMELTQFTNVPDVVLLSNSHVTAAAAPSNGNHLCNKTYVDNKTTSLQSAIHSAVNSSTDYASLKAALLAALA